jgi:hypothetical protein
MKSENWDTVQRIPVDQGIQDAQDIAAALLLRRVENMLRNGQPRQAIAHIVEMTGVEPAEAGAFVDELKANIFS